jgi:hypothetical protein
MASYMYVSPLYRNYAEWSSKYIIIIIIIIILLHALDFCPLLLLKLDLSISFLFDLDFSFRYVCMTACIVENDCDPFV